jgi:D-arabinose 1-dehydrogenase-like Zn-dependent alcohol dehydrogenase
LVEVDKRSGLKSVDLPPLTDAGMTPYSAIKKVRHHLGQDKSIGVIGMGRLGFYRTQYAKILVKGSRDGHRRERKRVLDIRDAKPVHDALSIYLLLL